MLFIVSILILELNVLPCYAAPGDTITVYTNQLVGTLSGIALNNNVPVSLAQVKNTATNTTISNISIVNWQRYTTSNGGYSEILYGTGNFSIRKNGINGAILWQKTITDPWINSGLLCFPMAFALPNVTLNPGETLDLVVSHNYTKAGYSPRISADRSWFGEWLWSYWLTDALVQQGVDNALLAKNAAEAAATNATNAYNAANSAATNSINAYNVANNANTNALNASNNSWYNGTYGGSSESVGNIAGYIRNTQLPGIDTKINNLQTSVTNIQNGDSVSPTAELDTVSGARATSSSSIQLVAAVSDNKSTSFTYSVNGGGYSALPADGKFNGSLPTIGPNNIAVRFKDDAGNITVKTINIWRLN